jgi:purine-cytosine permease-like protein
MLRALVDAAALFLSPFLAYIVWLGLRRRYPLEVQYWEQKNVSLLIVAGLAAAVLGFLALGLFAERHQGVYVPARVEHGKLLPGHID